MLETTGMHSQEIAKQIIVKLYIANKRHVFSRPFECMGNAYLIGNTITVFTYVV